MRVLGIDPGSETLGWGIIETSGSRHSLVDFGTVRSKAGETFSKRLLKMYGGVESVMEKFSPDVVSIEDGFFSVNVKTAMKLGQVRGVILLLAERRSLEIAEYAPRLVKQTVTGYGNADKSQVAEMVRILLKLKTAPSPYDAADALAIAVCHAQHARMREKIKKAL